MAARVVQHELDHLDGVLIIERTDDAVAPRGARDCCGRSPSSASASSAARRRRDGAVRRRRARAAGRRGTRSRALADAARPPRGRGRRLAPPPAKLVAERLGIPVLQPERPTAELELPAETIVVCAYGLLIPEALLERGLWLNVHPSLLPRWRGAAPVERAIMAGDDETGVTIHETVKELDAGPIAAQRAFPIGPEDDAGAVFARAAELAVELLDEVLPEPSFVPAGRTSRRTRRRSSRPTASSTSRGLRESS